MKSQAALVLGSGGARGTAHIGVIRELINEGFVISSVSGSSIGAAIGAVYASGKLDEFEDWICNLDRLDVFNLIDFTLSKKGLIKADRVLNELKTFIPDQNIEDLPIPFSAVATDILNKKEILFTTGSLWDAVKASISIPMVITPAITNDHVLVDGGVLNPVPVNRVARKTNDLLVAVNVNAFIPLPGKTEVAKTGNTESGSSGWIKLVREKMTHILPSNENGGIGYFQLLTNTTSLMLSQISKLTLEMNPPDLIINISRQSCGTFDFHKAKELIEIGRRAAKESLKSQTLNSLMQ